MTKKTTYKELKYFVYEEDELANAIRACGGSFQGGSEVLVVEETDSISGRDSPRNTSKRL